MQGYTEVRPVLGKGSGVFATRDIPTKEILIGEAALLSISGVERLRRTVASDYPALSRSLQSRSMRQLNALTAADARMVRAVAEALAELPALRRCEFLALGDSFQELLEEDGEVRTGNWVRIETALDQLPEVEAAQGTVLEREGSTLKVLAAGREIKCDVNQIRQLSAKSVSGIFLTNAVSREQEDTAQVYAAFARLNHSCVPNARAIQSDGMRGVFATRAIPCDEEVTVAYFDDELCLPVAKIESVARTLGTDATLLHIAFVRQQLFSKWGFWCTCEERCSSSPDLVAASEEALEGWLSMAVGSEDEEAEEKEALGLQRILGRSTN